MSEKAASAFYLACCEGNIDAVKEILPNLNLEDIDQIEPDGGTALHAAAQYGHMDIVKLLLDRGANIEIMNKSKKKAEEEASNDKIKELFVGHLLRP